MTDVVKIEGIGSVYAQKLKDAGYHSTSSLLEAGATPSGREKIAEETGISETLILKWVNRADLERIKGIGEEYSDLLEVAGVDTVPELAQRNAVNLFEKISQVNAEQNLVRSMPTEDTVSAWVEQAKNLPRKVTY